MKNLKLLSLGLGAIYVIFVGFFTFPVFLQASIFYLLFLAILYWTISQKKQLSLFDNALFLLAGILSVYLSITSNVLVQTFTSITVISTLLYYLIFLNHGISQLRSGSIFLFESIKLCLATVNSLFKKKRILSYLAISTRKDLPKKSVLKNVGIGLIMAVPVIFIFHILFSLINVDYKIFMSDFLNNLWLLIINFWKFIKYVPQTIIAGYIINTLMTLSNNTNHARIKFKNKKTFSIITIGAILVSTILLFFTFSFFQSKLIFVGLSELTFKQLSLYTQHGFWELLIVCFFGYLLISFVLRKVEF